MGNVIHIDVGDSLTRDEWKDASTHEFGPASAGDLVYTTAAGTSVPLSGLPIGATGSILTVSAGLPSWNTTLNGDYTINGGLNVTGNITGASVSGTTSLFSPSATFGSVAATGALNVTGLSTLANAAITNVTGATLVASNNVTGVSGTLTNLTFTNGFGGTVQLTPVTTNATYSGITTNGTAIVAVTAGQVCFQNASGHFTTGCATAVAKMPVTHMAMADIAASAAGVFLSYGYYANSGFTLLASGAPFYAASGVNIASVSSGIPATGCSGVVQILGRALSATSIFFNPDMTFIELV
jgi:hypothetical protein